MKILKTQVALNNKGSGLGVILYGMTLLLVLIFTAVNIVNSKMIESGYLSLRDAVQTASSGAVIHLLTTEREGTTKAQEDVIAADSYDIYLQLALGYLVNRNPAPDNTGDTVVQTGEINNFIKLDHQKVVNTTMALLEDAVIRRRDNINNTRKYQIMMFFIEPYQQSDGKKFFNIIAYGNNAYENGSIKKDGVLATGIVRSNGANDMKKVYGDVEQTISNIVNGDYDGMSIESQIDYMIEEDEENTKFRINLNTGDENTDADFEKLVREMETYPHYVIVVKDFALPTIFDGLNTNDDGGGIKSLFGGLVDDGRLKVPMCALNTGKVQRQTEDAGWSHNR